MKTGSIIKNTLKVHLAEWKQLVFIYGIFPLVLIMVISYFYKDVYNPDTTVSKISISFTDKDNSETSKAFINMFKGKNLRDIFAIKSKANYDIVIPENYEKNINSVEDSNIEIIENKRGSRNDEAILKNIINEYGKKITEMTTIAHKVNEVNVANKQVVYRKVISAINKTNSVNPINNYFLKKQKHLSSSEEQGTSTISFMAILMLMGCTASHYKSKESGYFKRVMSAPISKVQYFIVNSAVLFISNFVSGGIYIITIIVFKIAFSINNLPNLFIILTVQSILIASLASLIIAFFNKKVSNFVMMMVMYYQIIFGNIFIPQKLFANKIFELMSTFTPGNILSESYRSCLIFNSTYRIEYYVAIMFAISFIAYAISLIKVKLGWEE